MEDWGLVWLCGAVTEGLKRSLLEEEGGLRGARLCLVMPWSLEEPRPDVHALRISSCLTSSCNKTLDFGLWSVLGVETGDFGGLECIGHCNQMACSAGCCSSSDQR